MWNDVIASHRVGARRRPMTGSSKQSKAANQNWIASSLTLLAMVIGPQRHKPSSRDDFLPLLAEPFNAERDHVAGVEELRWLHAGADAGRGASGDDVAGQQCHELRNIGNALRHREDHGRGRSGLAAL